MAADKKEVKEKPLDKMTVKELREIAKQIPEITGVHGMNKSELLAAVKKARGIKDQPRKKAIASVGDIKAKIKVVKAQRRDALADKDKKQATILRRKLSRLKKKSRRAA